MKGALLSDSSSVSKTSWTLPGIPSLLVPHISRIEHVTSMRTISRTLGLDLSSFAILMIHRQLPDYFVDEESVAMLGLVSQLRELMLAFV